MRDPRPTALAALLAATALQPLPAAERPTVTLTKEQASAFARLALKGIDREYPNKPGHVLSGPADIRPPRADHPAFFGLYDWHSSVHGHWMLARLLRLYPDLPEAAQIRRVLSEHLTGEPRRRGRLLRPQGEHALRAALRVGVAAE